MSDITPPGFSFSNPFDYRNITKKGKDMNYCPNCGNPLGLDYEFCSSCGSRVAANYENRNDESSPTGGKNSVTIIGPENGDSVQGSNAGKLDNPTKSAQGTSHPIPPEKKISHPAPTRAGVPKRNEMKQIATIGLACCALLAMILLVYISGEHNGRASLESEPISFAHLTVADALADENELRMEKFSIDRWSERMNTTLSRDISPSHLAEADEHIRDLAAIRTKTIMGKMTQSELMVALLSSKMVCNTIIAACRDNTIDSSSVLIELAEYSRHRDRSRRMAEMLIEELKSGRLDFSGPLTN
jgi:hypothetical protein